MPNLRAELGRCSEMFVGDVVDETPDSRHDISCVSSFWTLRIVRAYSFGMKNARDELQHTIRHALSYIRRFIMQVIYNSWKMIVTQQVAMTLFVLAVTAIVYVGKGLITAEASSQNLQAVFAIIGITLIFVIGLSLVRTPFQLDREKEEIIKHLEESKPSSILSATLGEENLRLDSSENTVLKPNIVFIETTTRRVGFDQNKNAWIEDAAGVYGTIIKFGNEPLDNNQKIGELSSVIATIFFQNREGELECRIDKGIWLGTRGSVWFPVGTTQKLLIAYRSAEVGIVTAEGQRREMLVGKTYDVKVRLIGDDQWMATFDFELRINKDKDFSLKYMD